ncbi:membrane protein [Lactococcus piscium]|uniref:Membrane protein n=1 Tax=Pseudolactococcus piscium TaxID=1364 RepID=A0A2A5S313_9LACT|nr:membrane protein [Lactococcus piscium]
MIEKEGIILPTNKKEGIIFTVMMCSLMVIGMSAYNLWVHNSLDIIELAIGFIPGFIVAFVLDVFIVGVVAKKLAFKLPINKNSKFQLIITISALMVIGMVTFMSVFGLIMNGNISDITFSDYLQAWKTNIVMALPLQLLIVGPVSRQVLSVIQRQSNLTQV